MYTNKLFESYNEKLKESKKLNETKVLKEDSYDSGIFAKIEQAFIDAGLNPVRFIDDGILTYNIGWTVSDGTNSTQISCDGSWYDEDEDEDTEDDLDESDDIDKAKLLRAKIFSQYPDIDEEDEDYLNSLALPELIDEIKNRGWNSLLDESQKLEEKRNPENDKANELIRNSLSRDEYAKTHTSDLRKHGIKYIPPEKGEEWRGGALEGKEGRRLAITNDDWYKDRADRMTGDTYNQAYNKGYSHDDSYADEKDLHQKTYKDSKAEVIDAKSKVEKQRRKNARLDAKGELTYKDKDKLDNLENTIKRGVTARYTGTDKVHPDTDLKSFLNAKKHSDRPLPREKDSRFKRSNGKVLDPSNKDVENYKEIKSQKSYLAREKERNKAQDQEDKERIADMKKRATEDKARRDSYVNREEKEVNKADRKLQSKLNAFRKRMENK